MNRSSRESPMRGRRPSLAVQALQGRPVNDESLEFFSWLKKCPTNETKAGQPGGVQDESKTKNKVNRKVETDDLLCTDLGKNEYDWLLTPPAMPSSHSSPTKPKPSLSAKDNPKLRAVSATRPSRFSQETGNSSSNPKLGRSSSVTRSSISNTTTRSPISNSIARSSSISKSTIRSPISNSTTRPSSSNTIIPSINKSPNLIKQSPITQPVSSRLSSPMKTRNLLPDKPKPSTPPNTSTTTTPRQPTPIRRATSSVTSSSVPPVSRSSSLTRLPDTKNMKISKPLNRSVSVVKQRLLGASASKSLNQRPATSPVSSPRKNMTRSQCGESLGKSRLSGLSETRKMTQPPENPVRKLVKPAPTIDKTALNRTMSRKLLDTSAKITDKSIIGNKRASLYPRSNSNRLSTSKTRLELEPKSKPNAEIVPTDDTSHGTSSDRAGSDDGSIIRPLSDTTFESSRYDSFLLKEDVKNLNWLHGEDDSVLQSPLFHRFDPPPEPFDI